MKSSSLAVLSIIGVSLVAMGCNGQPGGDGLDGEDIDVPLDTLDGPDLHNGARPACLADPFVRSALTGLSNDSVMAGGMSASGIPMLPSLPTVSAACRNVIQDIVECALGDNQSVMDQESGAVYTGHAGLAKEWEKGPLSQEERRWVSACMIQRLNYYGYTIPILLEGDQPTIQSSAVWRPKYPFAESMAWGDIFSGAPIVWGWICTEEDVWSICPRDLGEPWVDTRVCDGVQDCGIAFVGRCVDACTPTPDGYWDCSANYGFTETIRVRMETNTHPPILGECH